MLHRPTLGWTVTKNVFSLTKANWKCIRSLLLLVRKLVFVG